ncbi:hypothetical protein CULT_1330019 [[Clostridium] ultunense Esp]|nr:hypothetical protein CULT_1330019 [[Clostridium] ultunense Esp]
MSDRPMRGGVKEGANLGKPDVVSLKAYGDSLDELEKSLFGMIKSYIDLQTALQKRMQVAGEWNQTAAGSIRFSTLSCLNSILSLQTQLLKKYETLIDSGYMIGDPLDASAYGFNEAGALDTIRPLWSRPEDWRKIREILLEINRYKDKKRNIANRILTTAVNTRPWINTTFVRGRKS